MDSTYVRARDISKEIVRLEKLQADGITLVNGFDVKQLIGRARQSLDQTGMGPLVGR